MKRNRSKTILTLILGVLAVASSSKAFAKDQAISNEYLQITWDETTDRLTFTTARGDVALRDAALEGGNRALDVSTTTHSTFGDGKSIEIRGDEGQSYFVSLFPEVPFAIVASSIRNDESTDTTIRNARPLSAVVDLGLPADELKTFGTGGLLAPDKNPGSYAWQAVVDPKSRRGVVLGWLTHERGSGVFFTDAKNGSVNVTPQIDYGRLLVPAGKTVEFETLAIGYFDDSRLGLEAYADLLAKVHNVKLKPQPTGYCTWYSKPHGGASDEEHIAELAEFAAKELAPYGFSVVQIDDKWQDGVSTNGPRRNFTQHDADGPYPAGMKQASDHIKSLGLTPGIWLMPFAGTHYDPFFKDRQDWFVKNDKGEPYETKWGGTCLDLTNPDTREYVRSVAHRIVHDWGYRYLKLDGLWTGTATPLRYVNSGYAEDNIGDAVFHDPSKTNIEAFRSGLRLVRETIGPDAFILGCNGPQNMRSYGGAIGLVDAMRVGPDNNTDWKRLLRGPEFGSRHYFMHGRVWYNDPDPVYVRESMPLEHAQLIGSWVAITGQLNLSSEWLPGLSAERLGILKRTMPSHGLLPRPVDLFENNPPRLWLLADDRKEPRRDVIGVFNWDDEVREFDVPLKRIGLEASQEYVTYDYWKNEPAEPLRDNLKLMVPAQSCRILAVRPADDHPQLLSTSRHVTQGIIDVLEETWNSASRVLSGKSHVVPGDTYELRIVTPTGSQWTVNAVEATGQDGSKLDAAFTQEGDLVRATVKSPNSQQVEWTVRFE